MVGRQLKRLRLDGGDRNDDDALPGIYDRQVLAFGIVGLAEGASRYWMSHHVDLAPSDLASRVADLAWYGLRGRPGAKQGPSGPLQSGK